MHYIIIFEMVHYIAVSVSVAEVIGGNSLVSGFYQVLLIKKNCGVTLLAEFVAFFSCQSLQFGNPLVGNYLSIWILERDVSRCMIAMVMRIAKVQNGFAFGRNSVKNGLYCIGELGIYYNKSLFSFQQAHSTATVGEPAY